MKMHGERVRGASAELESRCRSLGLALTIQRRAVFEELSERRDHPTADQVYEALHARLPGLSRTTVYRVLETLVEAGLARKVQHVGAVVRYDPMVERHHHLACEGCGRLVDLDDTVVPALALPPSTNPGFEIHGYSVSFTGLCPRCHRKKKEK